jgi:hypothetical protein
MDHGEPNGNKMTVALNPQEEINLGFAIPKAGLKPAALYDITLMFSNGVARTIRGQAINPETVLLRIGTEPDVPHALGASAQVSLTAANGAGSKVVFPLPSIAPALVSLHACIIENKGKIDKNAAAALLPPGLQKLMIMAGLPNVEPLSLEDIPPEKRPADYMWRLGEVVGGARQRDVPADKSLDDFIKLHLSALKEKCNASSFTMQQTKDQVFPHLTLATADATCTRTDHPVFLAILYYLSATHELSIITHEGPLTARADAIKARDALAHVIGSLAAQSNTPPAAPAVVPKAKSP